MVIILMGVAGAGKTTIGQLLAGELGWKFYDGDDYHPKANIEKMRQGIPLTDEDRIPWLTAIRRIILESVSEGEDAVIACSGLKQSYRESLLKENEPVTLVYLKGDYGLLHKRLEHRHDHFAGEELLASQFATLEEPQDALMVDVSQEPAAVVESIKRGLHL
jgi:gluconokinase